MYRHNLEQGQKPIKLDSMESVCMHDLEMLCKTFKISEGHSNVAYERNLEAKNSVDIEERQFDKFMENVLKSMTAIPNLSLLY